METTYFGTLDDGHVINKYTLINRQGMVVSAINYGGVITEIIVPDKNGNMDDVVLGYDNLDGYLNDSNYLGAIVGRCANRIAGAQFEIDGRTYWLSKNSGNNSLHGGKNGFNKKIWHIQEKKVREGNALRLTASSLDGEEGYPGKLNMEILYILTEKNELIIKYSAVCNKKTVVNMTNHAYFNLSAGQTETITEHLLQVNSSFYLPLNEDFVPQGTFNPVEKTDFDFTLPKHVGKVLASKDSQIVLAGGIDHEFLVSSSLKPVVRCEEPNTGRVLEIYTSEPAVHIYTGNFLQSGQSDKRGVTFQKYSGLAFETQHFSDSVHHKNFPSVLLTPGQQYFSETKYCFSVKL